MIRIFKVNERNRGIIRVLSATIVILVICFLLCFVHVLDVKSTYNQKKITEFSNYLQIASKVLGMEITQNQLVVKVANESLEKTTFSLSSVNIFNLLESYENADDFYEFQFIDSEYRIFNADRTMDTIEDFSEYQDISSRIYDTILVRNNMFDQNGNALLAYYCPSFRDGKKIGFLLAYTKLEGMLEGIACENLTTLGSIYIVDQEGNIISRSASEKDAFEKQSNIYNLISEYEKVADESHAAAKDISVALQVRDDITLEFQTKERGQVVVSCFPISNTENLSLLCVFNENIIQDEMQPFLLRSVLVCLMIILLMVIIIVAIWLFLDNLKRTMGKIAYQDPVTSGNNANYFYDRAREILNRDSNVNYIIQRIDIANFRYLNEAYGHLRANAVLKICNDTAKVFFYENELFARMDSDQFVALSLCNGETNERRAKFMDEVNRRTRAIGIKYPIRLKYGIYHIRKNDLELEIMIDRANAARKSLAGDEKVLIAYYSDSLIQNMRKIDKVESEMYKALEQGEFKVYLQPKWNITNDCLAGAEALVRWKKADGSIVYPDDFIPIFEKNGFIEKLDFYMLESVCKFLRKIMDDGFEPIPISINQSRILLHNPEYVQNICKVIRRHRIPEEYIELEITESLFFNEKERMISIMNELKENNIALSMDDFGSGYSSLNLLKDIPFDVLKIDRLFFSESITSKNSTWILKKIVEMAEGLGIKVVCEGVETFEQVNALRTIGCKYVQGYFYSKPIAANDFVKKYFEDEMEDYELSERTGSDN